MTRSRAASSGSVPSSLRRTIAVLAATLVLSSAGAIPAAAATPAGAPAGRGGMPSAPRGQASVRHACDLPAAGRFACHAEIRTDVAPMAARMATSPSAVNYGYGAASLQAAYGLTAAAAANGAGVTIAIIDAYDDPTAEADMAAYRSASGLPPCRSTGPNPCFRKVNQDGQASPLPAPDAGWSQEISLDLDMVSAICPNCSILLVEASSSYVEALGAAVNTAVAAGAKYISNSYGGPEDSSSGTLDSLYYKHAGVVITASTGDWGYEGYEAGAGMGGNQYPSVSPWVVAVGGTSLSTAANARGWTESAWADGGSGCSLYEPRPAWQSAAVTGCSTRMVADVSAVADPATGVAVVYNGSWYQMGGTSASAPIVAAAYALAGTPTAGSWPASYPYGRHGLNDASGGSNASGGSCSPDPSLWCHGVAGYDGPTGLGTPNGTPPFTAPTAPGSPTGVSASPGNASLAVRWVAPASDGGSPVTGYRATASDGTSTCAAGGSASGCTIAGLANGTAYTVTVTASNAVGTSAASSASAPATPVTVPGQPQSVRAMAGASSATVSWSPPASDGGSPVTGYAATASPGGATCAWAGGPYSCVVSGLTNGTSYTFTVAAANAVGTGLASSPSSAVTPRTVPGAPSAVTAHAGNDSAQVTWTAPASDGGSAITGYQVIASPGGATCAWSSGPLDCAVAGLANGTAYAFTVIASNVAGQGAASPASAPVTPSAVPDAATGVVASPRAPTLGALGVTWQAPSANGSPITSYTATAFAPTTYAPLASCTSSAIPPAAPATGCVITGLGNNAAVVVRVSATNGRGKGPLSAPSAPARTPLPVATVVAPLPTWVVQSRFTVSWSHSTGTYPVAHYVVRYRRAAWSGGFGGYITWLSSTTATSARFSPAPGVTYCFSAIAIDQGGFSGPWSAERCIAAPLDDRSLVRYGAWARGTGSSYLRGTWSSSYRYGAQLVRTGVRAKRIVLVATTCPTCGTVRVYLGRTLLRTISLRSRTIGVRRVFTVATFASVRSGTVTVKLSTSGRRVIIDGLGITRV